MLFRKKGRKIYTYRVKSRRVFSRYSPLRSALAGVLSVVILAVLGVVGYSVIGPIVIRTEQEKQNPTTVPEPFVEMSSTTTTTTTATTLITPQETTTTTTTTPAAVENPLVLQLADEVMHSPETLTQALADAKNAGYDGVVMPMKQYGGLLYYASMIEGTDYCKAVQSELTAEEIVTMAEDAGLIPMAEIVTIADYTYPLYSFESGYFFENSDDRWLDDKESEGGKPWLSPFAQASRDYLCAVAGELYSAGFARVLCADTEYPDFYESDLKYIGKDVSDPERRADGLAGVLNDLDACASGCAYAFDLYTALNKDEEAIRSDALAIKNAVITFDYHMFSTPFYLGNDKYDPRGLSVAEHTTLLLKVADAIAEDMEYLPCVSTHGLSDAEVIEAVEAFRAAGFDTVFVSE